MSAATNPLDGHHHRRDQQHMDASKVAPAEQSQQQQDQAAAEEPNALATWANEPRPDQDPQEKRLPWPRQILHWILWFCKDQWLCIGLAVVIVIASQVNVSEQQRQVKQTVSTYITVAVIFFITGCTLKTRILLDNYTQWKQILFVQVSCFFVTSSIMFGVVSAAASNRTFMDPWLLIGFLVNASVSTTLASNVTLTRQASGNSALTVVQTTVGNFISPFLSPALIKMYLSCDAWYTQVLPAESTQFASLYKRVLMQLGLSIYVPMLVGQVCISLFPNACHTIFVKYKMSKVSTLALLVLIWEALDNAFGSGAFADVKADNLIFVVFISFTLWLLWLTYSFVASFWWMSRPDVVSTLYCVPAKTAALGVPLTATFFMGLNDIDQAKIQIPVVLFQLIQIAFGSLLTIPVRRWAAADRAGVDAEKRSASSEQTTTTAGRGPR